MFAMKTGILMVVAAFAAMPAVAWQQVGVDAGVFEFADAHPDEWRSVKIISRDAGEVSPTVSIMRRKIGTSIHLAAVR